MTQTSCATLQSSLVISCTLMPSRGLWVQLSYSRGLIWILDIIAIHIHKHIYQLLVGNNVVLEAVTIFLLLLWKLFIIFKIILGYAMYQSERRRYDKLQVRVCLLPAVDEIWIYSTSVLIPYAAIWLLADSKAGVQLIMHGTMKQFRARLQSRNQKYVIALF